MTLRNLSFCLLLLFSTSALTATVRGEDKKAPAKATEPKKDDRGGHGGDDAMMAMMEQMMSPGPQHGILKQMAGTWDYVSRWRMDPAAPWNESKGISKVEVLFDGRYAKQELKGSGMDPDGPPFEGRGVTGYDNFRKKYVSAWIDNLGTGVMLSYGTADASGKVITYSAEEPDWKNPGKMKTVKSVYRIKDDKTHVFEMYDTGPDGKEYMSLEVTYTRK
jgi:hypothetical protein